MSGPSAAAGLGLIRSQLTYHPALSQSSFAGQTIIITGASSGLGRDAAKHFVRLGAARLILAVRTVSKGQDAIAYIEQATGRKDAKLEVWELDMTSFESVQAFAKRASSLERLDVVVANAGQWPSKFELAEGHEATITINVLSTFLLLHLLLPTLRRSARSTTTTPRVSVVSSTLHAFATLPARKKSGKILTSLDDPALKDFDGRYNDSKLLVQLYGSKLAASMAADVRDRGEPDVNLDFVCPGWCASGLHPASGFMQKMAEKMLMRSSDEGASCLVDAVAADKVEGRHGKFVSDMKVKPGAAWLQTEDGKATADRVWEEFNQVLMPIVQKS